MTIKELKRGDFFTKKAIEYPTESQVWVRGEYDRSSRKYECHRWDDVNRICLMKADAQVFTDLLF
jgi:hypothetical protein